MLLLYSLSINISRFQKSSILDQIFITCCGNEHENFTQFGYMHYSRALRSTLSIY